MALDEQGKQLAEFVASVDLDKIRPLIEDILPDPPKVMNQWGIEAPRNFRVELQVRDVPVDFDPSDTPPRCTTITQCWDDGRGRRICVSWSTC